MIMKGEKVSKGGEKREKRCQDLGQYPFSAIKRKFEDSVMSKTDMQTKTMTRKMAKKSDVFGVKPSTS